MDPALTLDICRLLQANAGQEQLRGEIWIRHPLLGLPNPLVSKHNLGANVRSSCEVRPNLRSCVSGTAET